MLKSVRKELDGLRKRSSDLERQVNTLMASVWELKNPAKFSEGERVVEQHSNSFRVVLIDCCRYQYIGLNSGNISYRVTRNTVDDGKVTYSVAQVNIFSIEEAKLLCKEISGLK